MLGVLIGFIIGVFLVCWAMVKFMIIKIKLEGFSFEQANNAIKQVIPSFKGWGFPIEEWQFYKSQLSKGLKYENITNMVIYFVCNPAYANKMLRQFPYFGGIMPCSWAVYETKEGDVFLAKMNIKMMSYIFPGIVGKIMKEVAKTEEEMLAKINKLKSKTQDKKQNTEYAQV